MTRLSPPHTWLSFVCIAIAVMACVRANSSRAQTLALHQQSAINAQPKSEAPTDSIKKKQAKDCGEMVGWTSFGSATCPDGKQYWLQRQKHEKCGLSTYYTFIETKLPGGVWQPEWNCEASKQYAPKSSTGPCFEADHDKCP